MAVDPDAAFSHARFHSPRRGAEAAATNRELTDPNAGLALWSSLPVPPSI